MSDDLTCHVCARTVTERGLLADCDGCGKRYHLNPRSDVEGIDCGDVWAGDDDAPALQFSCQPCLDAVRDQAPAPGAQATPPGMPLPPGAPPEALAALAGFAARPRRAARAARRPGARTRQRGLLATAAARRAAAPATPLPPHRRLGDVAQAPASIQASRGRR